MVTRKYWIACLTKASVNRCGKIGRGIKDLVYFMLEQRIAVI